MAKSTNIMLFAIVLMLFAIVLALISTGMGIVVFGIAFIGVFAGVCGLAWDDRAGRLVRTNTQAEPREEA